MIHRDGDRRRDNRLGKQAKGKETQIIERVDGVCRQNPGQERMSHVIERHIQRREQKGTFRHPPGNLYHPLHERHDRVPVHHVATAYVFLRFFHHPFCLPLVSCA